MDFTDDEADYSLAKRLDEFPNVIISRTFSKSFGMAGLRLGTPSCPRSWPITIGGCACLSR